MSFPPPASAIGSSTTVALTDYRVLPDSQAAGAPASSDDSSATGSSSEEPACAGSSAGFAVAPASDTIGISTNSTALTLDSALGTHKGHHHHRHKPGLEAEEAATLTGS
jgi:hypothetical protein